MSPRVPSRRRVVQNPGLSIMAPYGVPRGPHVNTSTPARKARAPIVAAALFIAVVTATYFFHDRVYYPHVVVEAQENVRLEFLQHGLRKDGACQAAVATIADAIRVSCPACRIAVRQCSGKLESAYEKLLSEDPIEMPSSRLPRGVVAYVSDNKALALAACRETERLTGAGVPAV